MTADDLVHAALERLSADELRDLEAMASDPSRWPERHRAQAPEIAERIRDYRRETMTVDEIARRIGT